MKTQHWKKFYFRDPSKSLCFKIFGSSSTFTATAQVITAIIRVITWAVAVNVLREPKNLKNKEIYLGLGSKQFWINIEMFWYRNRNVLIFGNHLRKLCQNSCGKYLRKFDYKSSGVKAPLGEKWHITDRKKNQSGMVD